jgi:hypothetical protein
MIIITVALQDGDGSDVSTSSPELELDSTQPRLLQVEPLFSTTPAVPVDTEVILTFSEPMDRGSTEDAFELAIDVGTPVAGVFQWLHTDTVLVFTPSADLEPGTQYVLSVSNSACDTSHPGNLLNQFVSTFVTLDPTPPTISHIEAPSEVGKLATMRISVRVTDDVEVWSVSISFTKPSGVILERQMVADGNTYTNQQSFHQEGDYTFLISAEDSSGNQANTTGGFIVLAKEVKEESFQVPPLDSPIMLFLVPLVFLGAMALKARPRPPKKKTPEEELLLLSAVGAIYGPVDGRTI